MLKNILLREDVKRDLKKARKLLEEFRVMRKRDQNQSQQDRGCGKFHEPNSGSSNKQSRRGGKRGAKQWNRGRGRGRGGNQQEHNFTRNNYSNQRPSLLGDPQEHNFTRNNYSNQRPSLLGEPFSQLAYWPDRGQQAPILNHLRTQVINPSLMGRTQQLFSSSNQHCQRQNDVQSFDTPPPLLPEQMASGNNPGLNTDRMEGRELEGKFASQRLSNESLNSNASSSSGNPNNQNNRGRRRGICIS